MNKHLFSALLYALAMNTWAQGGQLDPNFGQEGAAVFDIHLTASTGRDLILLPDGKILTTGTLTGEPGDKAFLARFERDGSPDVSFGNNGREILPVYYPSGATCMTRQADEKILIAGYIESSYQRYNVLIARFHSDGALDSTFGQQGIVVQHFGSDYELAYSIETQPDGNILIAGRTGDLGNLFLARYTETGQADQTFGSNGWVLWNIAPNGTDAVYDLGIQPDGKIVAAGYSGNDIALLRLLPDGQPDPSFGTDGLVQTDYLGQFDQANALAILSDGSIMISGATYNGQEYGCDLLVARYQSNGQPDLLFANDGLLVLDLGGYWEIATGLRIDDVGNITASGMSDGDFFALRFSKNGTPDLAFGTEGVQRTCFPSITNQAIIGGAYAMTTQPDGKILLAGQAYNHHTLLRYNPDGTADSGFGANGVVRTEFLSLPSVDRAWAIAQQADGNLVAAGYAGFLNSACDFCIVRVLPDGSPDISFGTAGIALSDFGGSNDRARCVTMQPDGKIIAAGVAGKYMALARYLPDGRPDPGFGVNGMIAFQGALKNIAAGANALVVQPDGKIVAAGYGDNGVLIARLLTDGRPDLSFGTDGITTVPFTGYPNVQLYALALLPNGKIIAAGENGDFLLLRLNADGELDTSFGKNGLVTTDLGSWNDGAWAMVLQPDGKIVAGGHGASPGNFILVRYLPDGTLDSAFGTNGIAETSLGYDDLLFALAIQADGKILAAGTVNEEDFALVRYLPSGAPDPSFGTEGVLPVDLGSWREAATALVIQADHRIVLAGYQNTMGCYDDFVLLRVLPGEVVSTEISPSPIQKVAIYGGPATDIAVLAFQLREAETLGVRIYGLNGQPQGNPVASALYSEGEHRLLLHTGNLKPGMYVVQLVGARGEYSVKMIK